MNSDNSDRRAAEMEEALKGLRPRQQEMLKDVLHNHPLLSVDEALEMLRYFGGL